MSEKSILKSSKLAGWIDDFATILSKNSKFQKKSENEDITNNQDEFSNTEDSSNTDMSNDTCNASLDKKVAEINLNDLDKIVWNDETYFVNFDENGANILNGFGNSVTTLQAVKTLEEVNERLNGKQIVCSNAEDSNENDISEELNEEINKALAYVDETSEDDETETEVKDETIEDKSETINKQNNLITINNEELSDIIQNIAKNMVEEIIEQVIEERLSPVVEKLKEIISIDVPENPICELYDGCVELPVEHCDEFKNAVCPICGEKLLKEDANDKFINIICSNELCNKKYLIDLNTEKIYVKQED